MRTVRRVRRAPLTVGEVLDWLKRAGSAKGRSGMARYGLPSTHTFGVDTTGGAAGTPQVSDIISFASPGALQ